jgi:hypothetical protein
MALKLNRKTIYGITAGYHEIVSMHINVLEGRLRIGVGSWPDQATQAAGSAPISLDEIDIPAPAALIARLQAAITPSLQAAVMAMPGWTGATAE